MFVCIVGHHDITTKDYVIFTVWLVARNEARVEKNVGLVPLWLPVNSTVIYTKKCHQLCTIVVDKNCKNCKRNTNSFIIVYNEFSQRQYCHTHL